MPNENSVITRIRRRKLCQASSDPTKPLAVITHIALGDGGTDADGEPLMPSENQTALVHEVVRYEIKDVIYPVETTARYTAVIPEGELERQVFSEAALVDSDGDLAAIKNMYPKKKDVGVAFQFELDDEF